MAKNQGILKITAPHEITTLRVLDPNYEEVAKGTYSLEVPLKPGIYQVQATVPGDQDEKLVSVWPGKTKTLSADDFNLVIKLPVSLQQLDSEPFKKPFFNEKTTSFSKIEKINLAYSPSASSYKVLENKPLAYRGNFNKPEFIGLPKTKNKKKQAHVSLGKNQTANSRLLIFAKNNHKNLLEVPHFVLKSSDEEVHFPETGEYNLEQGWLSLIIDLPAGTYVLEHEIPYLGKRGQIIFVEEGWETQVLVPWDTMLDFANATFLMLPLRHNYDQESITTVYEKIEAALIGLARNQLVMSVKDKKDFLDAKLNDPMLELIGCYALLQQPNINYSELEKIANHSYERLPNSPDAKFIHLLAQEKEKKISSNDRLWKKIKEQIKAPPVFACGLDMIEKILGDNAESKINNHFLSEILSNLSIGSIWTRWADPSPNFLSEKKSSNDVADNNSFKNIVASKEPNFRLKPNPLTGKELLQQVKALSNLPRRETAKQCGYYTETKEGKIRVNLTDFYDAVLGAKGVPLEQGGEKDSRGREPTFRVSVNKNGQIVIGSTYTKQMGLKPGDEFEIKLGYKHIHLKQLEGESSFEDEEDEETSVERENVNTL